MQESRNNAQHMQGLEMPDALQIKPGQSAVRKLLLSAIPLTPSPITGRDAWVGWTRLFAYGTLSAMTYKRARKLSYGFMTATGVSLLTSLAGEAYTLPQTGAQ